MNDEIKDILQRLDKIEKQYQDTLKQHNNNLEDFGNKLETIHTAFSNYLKRDKKFPISSFMGVVICVVFAHIISHYILYLLN